MYYYYYIVYYYQCDLQSHHDQIHTCILQINASLLASRCGGLPWGRSDAFYGFVGTVINPQMGFIGIETGFVIPVYCVWRL